MRTVERGFERESSMAVGYRLDRETAGQKHIAEQFSIEVVILDNENSLGHYAPELPSPRKIFTILICLTKG